LYLRWISLVAMKVWIRGRLAFFVELVRTGQRGDLHPRKLPADRVNGIEVALGGDGKSRLHDIDAEVGKLGRHLQLLVHHHAAAGALLSVPQRRVKNVNAIAHGKSSLGKLWVRRAG
jgi:hypothetical protein